MGYNSITLIVGARPNFVKIAPIISELRRQKVDYRLVHTGQHYSSEMSDIFFEQLNIPAPDINLGCGGGGQAEQTAAIMVACEKELLEHRPDLLLVVGDTTSAMACAVTAKKLNIRVAHVEAGIRSFDTSMPEEINRMVIDSLADIFFTTTRWATENLLKSGVGRARVHFVGNVMIDTLLANRFCFKKPEIYSDLGLQEKKYFILTLHRPANVDDAKKVKTIVNEIVKNSQGLPIIFPVHPRLSHLFSKFGNITENLYIAEPFGYLEFNYLVERSTLVLTDSGGVTEEATIFGVPCMTLRDNTERPETCEVGTNELVGVDPKKIADGMKRCLNGEWKTGGVPELWDGKTASRIVSLLV